MMVVKLNSIILPSFVEMLPKWHSESELPYNEMWGDDIHWIPHMLKGELFFGYFIVHSTYDITKHTLDILESLENVTLPTKPYE